MVDSSSKNATERILEGRSLLTIVQNGKKEAKLSSRQMKRSFCMQKLLFILKKCYSLKCNNFDLPFRLHFNLEISKSGIRGVKTKMKLYKNSIVWS